MEALRFVPVTRETWPLLERLFEAKGGPSYCWCMPFRPFGVDRQSATNAQRKEALAAMIEAGMPVGLVACEGDAPVGWCSLAPREMFRGLRPAKDGHDGEEGVWSVTCFYVPRARRRSGLAAALLDAAIEHAFAAGARAVEAYPVDPDSPSYRFMGFRRMFAARGFRETGLAGTRRHVMRLEQR